ncbi:glycosyltransferase [Brevundimonas sp. SL130]|uniref:glycosyltransferase n=1 Tax=Brevundimonas sp. SL130 TaxID=2995143 RepID=UPI00226D03AA|nr:glycosyltransferase [Brevundimonas sp. SL130]WAC60321.1 glycosyltransferase [Brevundimonas sp. SL130]
MPVTVVKNMEAGWLARVGGLFRKSNDTALREKGRGALREGRTDEAIEAFQRHLALRPRDGQTWVRLGNALKDAGRYDNAEVAYEKACKIRPRSAHTWLQRAHLARFSGDREGAAAYFRRSFELDGNAEAGRELLRLSDSVEGASAPPSLVGCIDGLTANSIFGWVVDPDSPDVPAKIEFLQAGVVVGLGQTSIARPDVHAAGYGATHAGFRVALNAHYRGDKGPVIARLSESKRPLVNSPFQPAEDDHVSLWLKRWQVVDADTRAELRRLFDQETEGLSLSIIMPIYNPPINWLKQALDSVVGQFCSRWELICIDDASPDPAVMGVLSAYAAKDRRIRILQMPKNGGISKATNAGLKLAKGDYVAFMDHDDALEPEAVYRMLETARGGYDLIYSDEVLTGADIEEILEVVARPAFSYDYYISHPYFVHLIAVKRSLAKRVGGLDPSMSISMDVDFVLRVLEAAISVAHIPAPLYRWRTHENSAGHAKVDAVMAATRGALERHHERLGQSVEVSDGLTFNTFRHDFPLKGRTLIIVPTKDRLDLIKPCVDSLLATTSADIVIVDHDSVDQEVLDYFLSLPPRVRIQKFSGPFNFSKMNNEAVSALGEGYDAYLFANNDLEAIEAGWLEHMQGVCLREDVGAVGALLLYSDDSIQHGGVVLNVGGPAEHVYKNEPSCIGNIRHPGHISGLVSVRDFMAVTGACLMVRADIFHQVGGFDPLLAVGFNDIDLCLRIKEGGHKVLFDGHAMLYHHESATRMKSKQLRHPEDTALMIGRWRDLLNASDPYFSPLFGNRAPAKHFIANPIDPYAPARAWTRRRSKMKKHRTGRVAPPIAVM